MASFKLFEIIDRDRIQGVIDCKNLPKSSRKEHNDNIKVVLFNYLKNNGVTYYNQINNFGRLYASQGASLQYFQKDIRRYLANGNYIDIDIVNCHPVIIEQLFLRYSVTVPSFLKKYNLKRDLLIKKYKLKDKTAFLKIFNNENYNGDIDVIRTFHTALYKRLLPKLIKTYELPKAKKKDYNDLGSKLAKILQHIENEILMIMYNKCLELNVTVGVLVFDGMMIEKISYYPQLLEILEKEVELKSKFNIKLAEKPMDIIWIPKLKNVERTKISSFN